MRNLDFLKEAKKLHRNLFFSHNMSSVRITKSFMSFKASINVPVDVIVEAGTAVDGSARKSTKFDLNFTS